MPLLGAHVSIAGGVHNSVARALDIGCDTFQIFTKNQRQWRSPPLKEEDITSFKEQLSGSGLGPVIAHDSYLINLGAPAEDVFQRSVEAFADEILRCSHLGVGYLVTHPGSHLGTGEDKGIQRIAEGIDSAWSQVEKKAGNPNVMILLETTAGQGTNIGYKFDQLAGIMELSSIPDRIGVCLDTCHIFAAGYEISSKEGYSRTIQEFDSILSLDKLKAIHLNDSKKGHGSRVDRHDNIGDGSIGLDGFDNLLNDERLEAVPMILETPGGDEAYKKNLRLLRSLSRG
jgi:deoxyribonuclease-4